MLLAMCFVACKLSRPTVRLELSGKCVQMMGFTRLAIAEVKVTEEKDGLRPLVDLFYHSML